MRKLIFVFALLACVAPIPRAQLTPVYCANGGNCAPNRITSNISDTGGQVFNVKAFGVAGAARQVNDAAIAASSSTLSSATAAFTPGDTGSIVLVPMGTSEVLSAYYSSGITATGPLGSYCTLTFTGGGGTGAAGNVYLTGDNSIVEGTNVNLTNLGTSYATAPIAATVSSGSATCSGTAVIGSSIGGALVQATATYVNSTTITLSSPATTAVSAGYMAIGPNSCPATTAAITAMNDDQAGQLLFPQDMYLMGNSCHLTITVSGTVVGTGQCSEDGLSCGSGIISGDPTGTLFTFTGKENGIHELGFVNPSRSVTGAPFVGASSYLIQRINLDHVSTLGFGDAADELVGALWVIDDDFFWDFYNCGVRVNNSLDPDAGDAVVADNLIASTQSGAIAGICQMGAGGLKVHHNKIQGGYFIGQGLSFGFDLMCPSGGCGTSELILEGDNIENMNSAPVVLNGGSAASTFGEITVHPGVYTVTAANTPAVYMKDAEAFIGGGTIFQNSATAAIVQDGVGSVVITPYQTNSAFTTPNSLTCESGPSCWDFSQLPNLDISPMENGTQIGSLNENSGFWFQRANSPEDYLFSWNAYFNTSWHSTQASAAAMEFYNSGWKLSYDTGLTPGAYTPTARLSGDGSGNFTLPTGGLVINASSGTLTYQFDLSPIASDPNPRFNRPALSNNNPLFYSTAGSQDWAVGEFSGNSDFVFQDRNHSSQDPIVIRSGAPTGTLVANVDGSAGFGSISFASLSNPLTNSNMIYCTDCKNFADDAVTVGTVAASGGHGAMVVRANGSWRTMN